MSPSQLHSLPWWMNTAWMWRCRREAGAFRAAAGAVRSAQERLLHATLTDNAQSRFGQKHAFASIRSLDDFRARVPITNYDALAPWIARIEGGGQHVLTVERVLMFEPTGGSAGGSKLIPYTATLRRQFQRAIASWIWDAFRHLPAVRAGTAYWSISPGMQRTRQTAGGTRIGFESDREYLDGIQRLTMSRLLVVPCEVARLQNVDNFRYATLAYLVAARDLALISIWSPTFLTALVDALPHWKEQLCRDLCDGTLRLPFPREEPAVMSLAFPRRRGRSREVSNVFDAEPGVRDTLTDLWPQLSLISCWADAAAEMYLPDLQSRFPGVPIQPKGLLATEGVISIPVVGHTGAALAIRSHVFEFLEARDAGEGTQTTSRTLLADELQMNGRYRVLLTTGGGLYRYDLGDVVEVVGFLRGCPLVRFRGRHGSGSDLVGEKLNEQHVRECLRATFAEFDVQPDFALLVPRVVPPGYVALVVSDGVDTIAIAQRLAEQLERRLRENPQYCYAVDLRQLRPVEVRWLRLPRGRAWQIYEDRCRQLGQKAGDVKPTTLDGRRDWTDVFEREARGSAGSSSSG